MKVVQLDSKLLTSLEIVDKTFVGLRSFRFVGLGKINEV